MDLPACSGLRVVAFDMGGGVQVEEVADWVSSIASARLTAFALDFGDRDTAPTGGTGSSDLQDKIKLLDKPLSELARRVYVGAGERLTMALVANNPSELVARLPEFRRVGNVWQGERVIGDTSGKNHFWSFLAATESERQEVDESILDYLKV